MKKATLFWDDQDPNAEGWWLRYDHNGQEDGEPIELPFDSEFEALAELAAFCLPEGEYSLDIVRSGRTITYAVIDNDVVGN